MTMHMVGELIAGVGTCAAGSLIAYWALMRRVRDADPEKPEPVSIAGGVSRRTCLAGFGVVVLVMLIGLVQRGHW